MLRRKTKRVIGQGDRTEETKVQSTHWASRAANSRTRTNEIVALRCNLWRTTYETFFWKRIYYFKYFDPENLLLPLIVSILILFYRNNLFASRYCSSFAVYSWYSLFSLAGLRMYRIGFRTAQQVWNCTENKKSVLSSRKKMELTLDKDEQSRERLVDVEKLPMQYTKVR